MEPLRKRFFINGQPVPAIPAHTPYLKPAAKLLDEVREQMGGGIEQFQRRVTLEDGATLTAVRRHGQTELHIDIPQAGGPTPTPGAFCVWENNDEVYAQILDWRMTSAVMDAEGRFIYARGDDEEVPNDAVLHPERRQGTGTIYAFNAETLEPVGSFKHDSGVTANVSEVGLDTRSNRFVCPFAPSAEVPHAVAYWAPGDLAYQQMTVADSHFYAVTNGGQFAAGGYFWTNSQRETRPGLQSSVPWFIDVYEGANLTRVGEWHIDTNNNHISIEASQRIGVIAGIYNPDQTITFHQIVTGTREPTLPATFTTTEPVSRFAFCMNNAGTRAWMSVAESPNEFDAGYTVKLYRHRARDGWQQIDVEGLDVRWPFRLGEGIDFVTGKLVTHDPVTDAVAFLMPDASAVHIFNAHDCMDEPIPPFSVTLTPPNAVYQARACQLHRGMLVFETSSETYLYPRYTTIGRAKIGRLFQHKITQP